MTARTDRDLLGVLLRAVPAWQEPVRHVEHLPAREGTPVDWPGWADPALVRALTERGVVRPWQHQRVAAEHARAGEHTVIATGTASGKSLAFQLPVLSTLLADRKACALYLSPTKALAADQLSAVEGWGLPGVRPAVYDGDTPLDERDWVRDHARLVLTNPDMLHHGLLPFHHRWARLLRHLEYVVIDECHSYRGVFGSQVAQVVRRLRRVARLYRSDPVFVLASATIADPAGAAARLIGVRPDEVRAVTEDTAPRAARRFVLWEPPLVRDEDTASVGDGAATPVRRSAPAETSRMLGDLVAERVRTLAFVRSRRSAEQVALAARRRLERTDPDVADSVAAYRGGYLAQDRRLLEKALDSGDLLGLASTTALELGIDITGLDATLIAGFPGTLASLWQQAGRSGRGGRDAAEALVVFVARDDPLDSYLVHHPEAVFGTPVEAAVTDPENPTVLRPQLRCAAAEARLTEDDLALFGDPDVVRGVLADLVRDKLIRVRAQGWYHVLPGHPAGEVDLRGSGAGQVAVVESATGRMLGTVDSSRAPGTVHPGAVHLHRGDSYVVDDLDLEHGIALVHAEDPDWTTIARSLSSVEITARGPESRLAPGVTLFTADVTVTEQVVAYQRQRHSGELIDLVPLDMPEHTLPTRAVVYTLEEELLRRAGITDDHLPGALHAAEHAAIGLLPLFAGCDRWDIGGLSTALHPDTGLPTVIVHDGHPGGAGFADRGHAVVTAWLTATRDLIRGCGCRSGCPSCIHSPKCGNGNHPLSKDGAIAVLDLVLAG